MAFKNFRQLALAALVVVAGSVSAFADPIFENIITWNASASSTSVTGTAGAGLSSTGGYGTEVTGSTAVSFGAYSGFYQGYGNFASFPTSGYVTFDLKSTDASTISSGTITQDFTGSFSVSSGANGTGTVYISGASILGQISSAAGRSTLDLNPTTNPAPTFDPNTGVPAIFTGGQLGGTLSHPYYTNGFNIDLVLASVVGFKNNTTGPSHTTSFTSAGLSGGDVQGYVPEPSTFSLLGLGAAGLAFGAYRRRKAAAAV